MTVYAQNIECICRHPRSHSDGYEKLYLYSSETSLDFQRTGWRYIPEYINLHVQHSYKERV
jgi:hypothetical protein